MADCNKVDYSKILQETDGVYQQGFVDINDLVFLDEVREICKQNACRKYGTTWACPPGIGTLEECRERIYRYNKAIMFTGKYALRSPFDWKGMMRGMKDFQKMCFAIDDKLKALGADFLMLDIEGCSNCEKCTYPDAPCRFPDKVHGSIEGYGMLVSAVAKKAGVNYNNGDLTVTYLTMIFFNE